MANLNETEYLLDTLSQRVEQLIKERNFLRRELELNTDGTLEHNKAFIRAYKENIISNWLANEKIYRLEYLLKI